MQMGAFFLSLLQRCNMRLHVFLLLLSLLHCNIATANQVPPRAAEFVAFGWEPIPRFHAHFMKQFHYPALSFHAEQTFVRAKAIPIPDSTNITKQLPVWLPNIFVIHFINPGNFTWFGEGKMGVQLRVDRVENAGTVGPNLLDVELRRKFRSGRSLFELRWKKYLRDPNLLPEGKHAYYHWWTLSGKMPAHFHDGGMLPAESYFGLNEKPMNSDHFEVYTVVYHAPKNVNRIRMTVSSLKGRLTSSFILPIIHNDWLMASPGPFYRIHSTTMQNVPLRLLPIASSESLVWPNYFLQYDCVSITIVQTGHYHSPESIPHRYLAVLTIYHPDNKTQQTLTLNTNGKPIAIEMPGESFDLNPAIFPSNYVGVFLFKPPTALASAIRPRLVFNFRFVIPKNVPVGSMLQLQLSRGVGGTILQTPRTQLIVRRVEVPQSQRRDYVSLFNPAGTNVWQPADPRLSNDFHFLPSHCNFMNGTIPKSSRYIVATVITDWYQQHLTVSLNSQDENEPRTEATFEIRSNLVKSDFNAANFTASDKPIKNLYTPLKRLEDDNVVGAYVLAARLNDMDSVTQLTGDHDDGILTQLRERYSSAPSHMVVYKIFVDKKALLCVHCYLQFQSKSMQRNRVYHSNSFWVNYVISRHDSKLVNKITERF